MSSMDDLEEPGPLKSRPEMRRSGYSATSLVQNTQAYSRDGRVRTSQELERTVTRRMSVDPATLHPARPVLSADELTGQDEEVDAPGDASASANGGMRHGNGSSSALNVLKQRARSEWTPEYRPESHVPQSAQHSADTVTERATRVSLQMIMDHVPSTRKTKVICTMGPKCWSEETLHQLLDAGMNMARFNFSHGDHAGHGSVLERVRKVCAAKGVLCATMLDTKGPEIRTAMLRNHEAIELEAGQEIIVQAVGDEYTTFEGYKTAAETRIGLSYAGLCQSMAPGKRILLADGSISIEVMAILSPTELRGRVLNSKKLGERKNCNLPGVKVDIPVLTLKDIDDLQNFGCKLGVDFVAASFVQSADDVKFIRRVLDEAGGQGIRIISKIENQAGLNNFDEILKYTDGVMVARGDLGMEIPSWKVPQAQKMLITKCNIAGKFVVTATQMLESMCTNPLPTRAEMTDVANAVFDGTDAVMLSGETANGEFPREAVETMAAIVENAELGVDYYSQYSFIQYWNTQGRNLTVSARESTLSSVSKMAVDFSEDTNGDGSNDGVLILVLTETGAAADLVTKYRPPHPIVVVSPNAQVLRQCSGRFGQYGFAPSAWASLDDVGREAVEWVREQQLVPKARKVIIAHGANTLSADDAPVLKILREDVVGMKRRKLTRVQSGATLQGPSGVPVARSGTASLRSTSISLSSIIEPLAKPRSTKIVCTMGPKCWSEASLHQLLDAGMNLARFNFSHGDHAAHGEVLKRFRRVCEEHAAAFRAKNGTAMAPVWATMLDTKGPEIRTAMLRNHEAIELEAGQEIIVQAVGDAYTTFEGYKTAAETRIGLSYAGLCQSMAPGKRILIADGSISIEVMDILSATELRGRVMNSKKLGERKNCNLPGVKVDIPVLTSKDIDDLQNFACLHDMDFVAASFVQSADDVKFIRAILDDAGGKNVKIISKIENQAGLQNFDEILKYTDGVMVARGDLGMEIPSEKVALAQKMLITKCTVAGKFVITATQMLESMCTNPLPTRAEMTDVANAVFDGTDAVMLSGETANGEFPREAVETMAAIVTNAEHAQNNRSLYNFIRNHTSKPMTDVEAICSSAVQTSLDMGARAIVLLTSSGRIARLVAKYRPDIPVFSATNSIKVAQQGNTNFGVIPLYLTDPIKRVSDVVDKVVEYANKGGIIPIKDGDQLVVIHRRNYDTSGNMAFRTIVVGNEGGAIDIHTPYEGDSVLSFRSTKVGIDVISEPTKSRNYKRKTKIVCTMGPKCWSEETLGKLLDAGMNVARFNFSHGDHAGHGEVLARFRRVCDAKNKIAATMLDTKGPEIRTAMLRNHEPIELVAGQEIIVQAVGDDYTTFEGYKTEAETRIGLSYNGLCQSMAPGKRILIADGSISIEVLDILTATELRGRVLNSKKLGERKNCNLPGVKVDIPVLTLKDIDDLQNFGCKLGVDFVAASFVQSADDVKFIRRVLDEAGGQGIRIISKIENQAGLNNFDEILKYTDGVMVARGDLGMEIPSEKVALAQKLLITKSNIAGKFVITATQMLESMCGNPTPTRAEMTDVANAVFDGTDAVMLSGETANGEFPTEAVHTMHRICKNAELGINYYQVYDFIRDFTPKPVGTVEAFVACAAKNAVDLNPGMILAFSEGGKTMRLAAKYRPGVPVMVCTSNPQLARQCSAVFGLFPHLLDAPLLEMHDLPALVEVALAEAVNQTPPLCPKGAEVIVLGATHPTPQGTPRVTAPGSHELEPLPERQMYFERAPGHLSVPAVDTTLATHYTAKTLSLRATSISLGMVTGPHAPARKTKIIVTLGAKCWSEETISAMFDAGMSVGKFNLKDDDRKWHAELLGRFQRIACAKGLPPACMLDTLGPVIRTGPLTDHMPITLTRDSLVTLVADPSFVGYRNNSGSKVGVTYTALSQTVVPGSRILLAYGALELVVESVASPTEVIAKVVNTSVLMEHTAVYLPGAFVDLPVLTEKDVADVRFGVAHGATSIALSFTQSAADVMAVRAILDEEGAEHVRVFAKIENLAGLKNVDEILLVSDGIMVARGDLGMDILPEKVALAQKLLVTKCNIAGKPCVVARHLLESMISNQLPTRAEMTDVANAVLDGASCVMMGCETAAGDFPVMAVATCAAICANAEQAANSYATFSFIRDFSPKPFNTMEALTSSVCKTVTDTGAALVVCISDGGNAASGIAKYRPPVPVVVVTTSAVTTTDACHTYGVLPHVVDSLAAGVPALVASAVAAAVAAGAVAAGAGPIVLVHGIGEPCADEDPMLRIVASLSEL